MLKMNEWPAPASYTDIVYRDELSLTLKSTF